MARPPAPLNPAIVARLHLAAAQEFGALGLEHASLNRILAASGVAKSTFYHRYENKQALYEELIGRVESAVESALELLDAEPGSAAEFWRTACDVLAELDRAMTVHPELKVVAGLLHRTNAADDLWRLRGNVTSRVRHQLVEGQRLGAVRTDVPASLLTEIVVASLLAVDAWALARPTGDDAGRPEDVSESVAGALRLIRDMVSEG